ncbi:MAG: PKD domain-containing protein [Pyrinomonadaceae bacterium]
MRFARRALMLALTTLALCAAASAQTLRSEGDPRNIAPTVGTGGPPGGPTGLFTIYDGQTLRKGEYTFSFAYSNYDRDPGSVDITEVPVSFQIGLSDNLELFFNTDAYRGIKVNNPASLSSFYLPNSQLFVRRQNANGTFGPLLLQSGAAIIQAPIRVSGPTIAGAVFRPVGNQGFVQFPFIGQTGPNFGLTGNATAPPFVSRLGVQVNDSGNFGAASNFPGIGSIFGSILPGVVLSTRVVPATSTFGAQVIADRFSTVPSYLPDAPFVNRLYGESSFNTFSIGAKIRLTDVNNALGAGLIPFYRFYADSADDASGFNQLQRGSSPGGDLGDFGLIGFVDGRLTKHVNVSANFGYILNSNPKSEALNDAVLLDRPDEIVAGIGIDFPVNRFFQPILELKSVQYVGGRTPNVFQNNPIDGLAGVRIYPRSWLGFSAAYRAHINQQGDRIFNESNPSDFPFTQSEDPHGYLFQFFIGRRNERLPEELPNQPPTVTLASNPSRVTIAANCGPEQMADPGCTPTSTSVQLSASASDPDGDTLLYTWNTTGGRITGDGPNVSWDLSGVSPGTYTATVEVNDGCGCVAFSSTTVTVDACGCVPTPTPVPTPSATPVPTPSATPPPPPDARRFDEYGNIRRNDVKARLDNFAIELQNDPSAQGYIIAYGGRRSYAGEAQERADFAKNYLVNTRGIDAGRIVTVDGGYKEEASTELWIVPSGANTPTASPAVDASEVQIRRRSAPRRGSRRRRGRDDDE